MSASKITASLEGVPKFLRALELADPETRARTKAAIERGTKRITAGAQQRAPKVTGELASTIRDEYSADGMTGYVKVGYGTLPRRSKSSSAERKTRLARKRRSAGTRAGKGAYAPVVEHGDPRRHHKAHPFLVPEFIQDRPGILADLQAAAVGGVKAAGVGE